MGSLEITYDELRREVGRFLGYDRTPSNWDTTQSTDVADILRRGVRSFYWPEAAHQWSFLAPVTSIQLSSGQRSYSLPSNFGGLLSEFTFAADAGRAKIKTVDEETIRAQYAKRDRSGPPSYAAIRVVSPTGDRTRHEALFYPVPDEAWTITFRYAHEPDELSASQPIHLGGPAHSQTVLEACLAAAEQQMNAETLDLKSGAGFHTARFLQRLQASIELDKLSYKE